MSDFCDIDLKSFINEIPKSDVHVHLGGSVRVSTLIDLSKEMGLELPAYTEKELNKILFKDKYENLQEYLAPFKYTEAVMARPKNLERIAYEFAWDNINEGVCYVEVRFAPQNYVNEHIKSIEDVFKYVNNGLNRAKKEYNKSEKVKSEKKISFEYGIIACAIRSISKGISPYFDMFLNVHKYSTKKRVAALASYELVLAMKKAKISMGIPIVGFDLAGAEAGFPAGDHEESYGLAHKFFFNKTVHAGEAYGPESIFQAISNLHADRLGHGYHLFSKEMISNRFIKDKDLYIERLAEYIADRRITIEVCLTSNLQTHPNVGNVYDHSFKHMLKHKLSTTICTDNRTISKTTVSKELELAVKHFKLTRTQLRNNIIYGFKRSFYPGTYMEKRKYVSDVIDKYEAVEKKYFGSINRSEA